MGLLASRVTQITQSNPYYFHEKTQTVVVSTEARRILAYRISPPYSFMLFIVSHHIMKMKH
jgi:uncharacterized membrane protein